MWFNRFSSSECLIAAKLDDPDGAATRYIDPGWGPIGVVMLILEGLAIYSGRFCALKFSP